MLLGIHPLLTGSVLKVLDELGHGDTLVISDANFPAHSVAAAAGAAVLDIPGASSPDVLAAVRTVFPADTHEGPAVQFMEAEAGVDVAVQDQLAAAAEVPGERIELVERFAFYDVAKGAAAIIRTGEGRPYGNVIIRKGVVPLACH